MRKLSTRFIYIIFKITMLLQYIFSTIWTLLGRLHPLTVHFPVALIVFAAVLELVTIKHFNSRLRPGIRLCVLVGALSAAVSALLGLILSKDGDYGVETLNIHQWSGIITAALAVGAALILYGANNYSSKGRIKIYRAFLFTATVGIVVTGHFGAYLTHGEDYLSGAFGDSDKQPQQTITKIDFASLTPDTAHLTAKQEMDLNIQVKAIFAHNCYKCHGAEKIKGDLRLDNKKMIFRGGESGPLFVAGHPSESEIIRRLTVPRDDSDAMPPKGKKIGDDDIRAISFWIQKGAPWPDPSANEKTFRIAKLEPRNPVLPADPRHLSNPVDLWVNDYFSKNKIKWPNAVDDRIFLRRIYLDIIGLLPTPQELDAFEKDNDPAKRSVWVRQLLNRNDDYAINWLTFWNDALRNDYTGTGYITGGRSDISDWLFSSLKNNKPYNQFVQQLISPDKNSKGFIEGIKWRGVVNASQRTEIQAAQNVSQVFLGLNLKCASCHNSFINEWKLEDAYAFANIFSDTSLEINRCDKPTGKYTNARLLWPQLGSIDSSASHIEKQKELAALLVRPENGRIYRTIVNRIWQQLMGRGMVEPVDMMDNEPWSQDLLDWLAYYFTQQGNYDLKELIYLITTSRTYQFPSIGLSSPARLTAQDFRFTGMVRRRMTAEQFSDAVGNIVWPIFADSMVRYKPVFQIRQSINRASLVQNNAFLTALGRPNRETVSTSRESQANLLQALELTNGSRFIEALKKGSEKWTSQYPKNDELIRALYLKSLMRQPEPEEMKVAMKMFAGSPRTEATQDLLWAIVLLPEFQLIF
jgi:mono/diheme cytochrome c family protein/uncharacterized membrane protein